jgi:hypothetical protein
MIFNFYFFENPVYIPFISGILLLIGDIVFKLDPKIRSLLNKTTIEKQLFNIKLTLISLIVIFLLEIFIIELDNVYLLHSNS